MAENACSVAKRQVCCSRVALSGQVGNQCLDVIIEVSGFSFLCFGEEKRYSYREFTLTVSNCCIGFKVVTLRIRHASPIEARLSLDVKFDRGPEIGRASCRERV